MTDKIVSVSTPDMVVMCLVVFIQIDLFHEEIILLIQSEVDELDHLALKDAVYEGFFTIVSSYNRLL